MKRPDIAVRPLNSLGGRCAARRQECRQFADIGLIGTGEIAVTARRTTPARPPLTRLADFAFFGGCHRLGGGSLGHFDNRLFAGNDDRLLLDFAFRTETFAIAIAAVATILSRLALAIGALFAILLLARLFALALLIAFGLHIVLLRRGLGRSEARIHIGHVVVEIIIMTIPLAILSLLRAGDDAEIMLGMLEIVLGHDQVAR